MYDRLTSYAKKIFKLDELLSSVTDGRPKPQISTAKTVAAITAMHLSNLGSLNCISQEIDRKGLKKDIPSVSTIARSADTINLDKIREVGQEIYKKARGKKMLSPCHGMWVGIVDGHEQTTSAYCKCKYCKTRTVTKKDGKKELQYYHQYTAFILAGDKVGFMLDIEPVIPGEGEISSAYRLISRVCRNYPKAFGVVIGDALYLKETIFRLLTSHHKYAIAVLKEQRRQLFEEANQLSLLSKPKEYRQGKTNYRVWDHSISGCWDGYGDDVRVIVSEETTTKRVHKKEGGGFEYVAGRSSWMWVTNLPCPPQDKLDDLKNTVSVCHSRWQIENGCFNETVNTWNGDHVYRHTQNAIIAFLLLLFICINIFNIFRLRNVKDKSIRTKVYLIGLIKAGFYHVRNPFLAILAIPPP